MAYQKVVDQNMTVNQRLNANQDQLRSQEDVLMDTLGLMKDTHHLLKDGHQNLQGQTTKINQAIDYVG